MVNSSIIDRYKAYNFSLIKQLNPNSKASDTSSFKISLLCILLLNELFEKNENKQKEAWVMPYIRS